MTAEQILKAIKTKRIKLSPVIGRRDDQGKMGRLRVIKWCAGFRVLASDGWQNIVVTQAEGRTPEEAVENLINSKLTVKNNALTKLKAKR